MNLGQEQVERWRRLWPWRRDDTFYSSEDKSEESNEDISKSDSSDENFEKFEEKLRKSGGKEEIENKDEKFSEMVDEEEKEINNNKNCNINEKDGEKNNSYFKKEVWKLKAFIIIIVLIYII